MSVHTQTSGVQIHLFNPDEGVWYFIGFDLDRSTPVTWVGPKRTEMYCLTCFDADDTRRYITESLNQLTGQGYCYAGIVAIDFESDVAEMKMVDTDPSTFALFMSGRDLHFFRSMYPFIPATIS